MENIRKPYSDKELEMKWLELEDIPFDEDENGELILSVDWWMFMRGTSREYIWHFFDENHNCGVAWLVNELPKYADLMK